MNKGADGNYASLINKAGVTESLELAPSTESARIEVIPKMDSVYADLVRYQMELEQKNSALEEAQQFIGSVLSSMTDALIVCDTEGKIQKVNGALEKLTGKPAETFMQCPLGEVDANVEEPRLLQRRRDLKIDRIMEDMGPLIDGTLEGAERVSDIVQDLRRYSGGQKEKRSRFELPLLVKKAVQWVIKAGRVKPEVHYELPDNLEVEGCRGQVHQILVNLVQNAVDAMAPLAEPELRLICETGEENIEIHVIDQGPGIPKQDLAQVFDPFFTSKPVGQGTGLGLYISYGLARDLGGDLRAENHPQGGAVFTLSLPAKVT